MRREGERLDAAESSFAVPGLSRTMTYGTGVNGDKALAVHGDVQGEAELKVTFNAGTELVTIVEQARQVIKLVGQLNSNGVGTTGRSSPDAAAPSAPTSGRRGIPRYEMQAAAMFWAVENRASK